MRALADEFGMALHMDGARLMNAVVASGHSAREFAASCDSVWIDLSKGLGRTGRCGAGRERASSSKRRGCCKHRFGGAMRQAGIIAAAGLYAFEHHVERLAEDHENARAASRPGCDAIPGVTQINGPVETNIVLFDVSATGKNAAEVERALEDAGRADGAVREVDLDPGGHAPGREPRRLRAGGGGVAEGRCLTVVRGGCIGVQARREILRIRSE